MKKETIDDVVKSFMEIWKSMVCDTTVVELQL